VLQRYVDRPLLVDGYKFHIRTYVVVLGSLQVYVHDHMLALLALHPYDPASSDRLAHITNTCAQQELPEFDEKHSVRSLDEIAPSLGDARVASIKEQVRLIVAETLLALVDQSAVFLSLPNCFELFGFDFLVDAQGQVMLLEANAGPDLKNTGDRLDYVILSLLKGIVKLLEATLFSAACAATGEYVAPQRIESLQCVLSRTGRRWGKPSIQIIES